MPTPENGDPTGMNKSRAASSNELSALFRPNSIAVVGASPTQIWGRQALENIQKLGYSGKVAVVNPKYEEVLGYPCYPSIKSMPFVPEAIFVLRNRESTVSVIEEAADAGVRAAVAVAIGFAETGAEGAAAQARIVDVAQAAGLVVVGPNCSGLINWVDRVPLHLGDVQARPAGRVALFAQGGGPKTSLVANKRGVHWSHIVTCGNEAVLGSADFLRYFVDDPRVKVICGFVEAIRDPERFFFECDRARAANKPVIILKAGRSEAAQRMAAAHTGALASPYRLYRELFRRHGVVQVESMEDLLASAIIMQARRSPGEGRLGVASASGGLLELILDESAKYPSLNYPNFEARTASKLRDLLPNVLECKNPLDSWGVANMEDSYPKILETVARDPNFDVVATFYDPNQAGTGNAYEQDVFADSAVKAAAATDKLVTLITPLAGSTPPEAVEDFLDKDVAVLGIQDAFGALDRAVRWARPVAPIADEPPIDSSGMAKLIREFEGKPFAGRPALDFLAAAGIPVVESRFVTDVNNAVRAAEEVGYPVVVKIGDTGTLHRTELSGVVTNLRDAQDVSKAAERLFSAGSKVLIIQPYVRDGIEMILGLETDDVLGTFVLIGQGGIWTEIMDDAALRPVGLRVGEPEQMLAELRTGRLLRGVRGAAALDTQALVGAVRRLDAIARSLGDQLRSIDINPLFVRKQGVVAVDALIVPAHGSRNK
ncbi:acetate--CoA ligase family protein [Bradyrhizobium sp. ORS 86]|uniref:acetate--CoA ligase family protein n=1 Tax=Bradyrhizobium sp. ORS 86 TaxID=1685970 RepID=UPI003890C7CB